MLPTGLPALDHQASDHLKQVQAHISQQIATLPDGFMPFDQWMDLALYAPGLGYYAAESTKFGSTAHDQPLPAGDFTTAPELSPLFGQTLARQIAQVLEQAESVQVLEFGAGSGALASAIIPALQALGINPDYQILDVSADLKARQQQRLQGLTDNVRWLSSLPDQFSGCVIANEVLDAMPATLFRWDENGRLLELGVKTTTDNPPYILAGRPPATLWHKPSANACRHFLVISLKSTCEPRPGSPKWVTGCNVAPRY